MRKLAHIERIDKIEPIEGADNIEVATVLGWYVVVKKNEFKVGDLVVYIEIDSVVPEKPEFEFLRSKKFRVKTVKLRKQVSQGLVVPIPDYLGKVNVGDDVTEKMGITHYDPESNLHVSNQVKKRNPVLNFLLKSKYFRYVWFRFFEKRISGAYPSFISKTDEERCQNLSWTSVLSAFRDVEFVVTEKIDGQSFTAFAKRVPGALWSKNLLFGVCSRNQWLKTPDESTWWRLARQTKIESILRRHYNMTGEELCIQGECTGEGIQKNRYKINGLRLFVFNIIDITNPDNKIHWDQDKIDKFCAENSLETVPVLDRKFKLPESCDEMVRYADGKSVINPNTHREGVVVRVYNDNNKMSFKAISNKFLLKEEE